ncbi:MAG TPA: hypothetical protein VJB94_05245 [Candidatus Nanoarchaeia archaeon]|nr:hypothetical protein [Candidatus Nanoarchaeia archaeon]
MEEIEFIYDELLEQNKRELTQIFNLIRHPMMEKNAYALQMFSRAILKSYTRQKKNTVVYEAPIDFSKYKKTNQAQQLTPVNPMKIIQPFPNVVVDYKPLIQAPKKDVLPNVAKPSAHLEIEEKKDNASYPLIIEEGKPIVTALVNEEYQVNEPSLYESDKKVVERVKEKLGNRLNLIQDDKILADYIEKYCKKENVSYNKEVFSRIKYYMTRDLINYGKIDPFLHDKGVEKIICDSSDKFISVDYKGKKLLTNIKLSDDKEVHDFIIKLAEKAKFKLSEKEPLVDFKLDNLRVMGTLGTSSARPNFTIIKEN